MPLNDTEAILSEILELESRVKALKLSIRSTKHELGIGDKVEIKVKGRTKKGRIQKITKERVHVKLPNNRIPLQRHPKNVKKLG